MAVFIQKNARLPEKRDSASLYTWCSLQRLKYKKGTLGKDKAEKLNSIDFIWNLQDASFMAHYQSLVDYRKQNPERWPSQRSVDQNEHKLAVWFLGIRKDYRNNKLSSKRLQLLQEIDFPFDPRIERWMKIWHELDNWVKKKGQLPRHDEKTRSGKMLYNWYQYQTVKMENDVLSVEQKKLVRSLSE